MYARIALLLLLLWGAAEPAAATWKPLLPLQGQAVHVPFLAHYLKDQSVFKINSKKDFDEHKGELRDAKEKILRSKRRLQEYFLMLSESCYYLYYQRKTASLSREEQGVSSGIGQDRLEALEEHQDAAQQDNLQRCFESF